MHRYRYTSIELFYYFTASDMRLVANNHSLLPSSQSEGSFRGSQTEILTGGSTTQRTFRNFSGFFVAISGPHGMKTEAQLQYIKRIWRREFHLFSSAILIAQEEAS